MKWNKSCKNAKNPSFEGALYMGPSTLVPLYTPTDLYFIFARGALKILANVGQTF